jgi:phage tail protein X
MAKTVRTSDGDILDTLCLGYYGNLAGTVETVLDANPGLASIPQPYPSGVIITFPDLPAAAPAPTINLWT